VLGVTELGRRFLAADLARAVELCPGLDDQFANHDITIDPPAGGDFQSLGLDAALELPADEDSTGLDVTLDATLFTDGNLGIRAHRALEATVDMQVVAQGKVADQL